MLDNDRTPFYIISANVEGQTFAEAFEQSFALKAYLDDHLVNYKVVSGCFEGQREVSFLVVGITQQEALHVASRFDQDCILAVDHYREARLLYTKGASPKPLGWFVPGINCEDNYTIHNGTMYVCTGV